MIRGAIFDFDGTLFDSMSVWETAGEVYLRSAGCGRIILGCTEQSLIKRDEHLDSFYIDSMEVLAKHAILAFGKTPIGFEED